MNIITEPLTGHDLTGMFAMGLVFLGLMLGFGGSAWFTFRKERLDAEIKQAMIARGYSAREIVEVIAAKPGCSVKDLPDVPPAKPVKQATYSG